MTDTELHDGFSLDLKSPSCDILTQSRGTSVVDMNKVVESIALLESISLDRVEVNPQFLSSRYLTYQISYENLERRALSRM